jgi:hypothetical protein
MAIEGTLAPGGGADLLRALWRQERTGILDIAAGGVERKLVLVGGEVLYVTSSESAEKLPVRLASAGLVDRALVIAAAQAGPDLRATLAARGLLAAEAHDRELRALVADVVARVFAAEGVPFQLVDKAELAIPGMLPENPMGPVLWAAARRAPAPFAARFLGDTAQRLLRQGGEDLLAQAADLTPAEAYVTSRIDGYGSVRDLLGLSPLGEEATLRLLLGLACLGVVDVQGRPTVRLPKPTATKPGARKKAAPPVSAPRTAPAGQIPGAHAPRPAAATPEPADPLEAARELHQRIQSLDHYGVLGVGPVAPLEEIRRAYYGLARTCHPDRFGRDLAPHDREIVEDLFARVGAAFETLADEALRRTYDERLRSGAVAAEAQAAKTVDRRDIARESHARGRALLAAGDRSQAERFLAHACEADPDHLEYRLTLARLLMSDARTRRKAEQHLVEAMRIAPSFPESYLLLGQVYKAANLRTRALEQFRKGLGWDATHAGLLREIHELEAAEGAGGLSGLFGRKKA